MYPDDWSNSQIYVFIIIHAPHLEVNGQGNKKITKRLHEKIAAVPKRGPQLMVQPDEFKVLA